MKCPIAECLEGFIVTHKAYPAYYKYKKSNKNHEERPNAPRWQVASITNHLKKTHFMNMSVDDKSPASQGESENSDDKESVSDFPKGVEPPPCIDDSDESEIHLLDDCLVATNETDIDITTTESGSVSELQTDNIQTRSSINGTKNSSVKREPINNFCFHFENFIGVSTTRNSRYAFRQSRDDSQTVTSPKKKRKTIKSRR